MPANQLFVAMSCCCSASFVAMSCCCSASFGVRAPCRVRAPTGCAAEPTNGPPTAWRSTRGGLKYLDEHVGKGALPVLPQVVKVAYTGSLLSDGRRVEFDDEQGKSPLVFQLREMGAVWQDAIEGMRVGGTRRVLIPPSSSFTPLQTGAAFAEDPLGEGETIRLDLELLAIETGPSAFLASLKGKSVRPTPLGALFLLSLLPYLLPPELQPGLWQGGDLFHPFDSFTDLVGGMGSPDPPPAVPSDPLGLDDAVIRDQLY